MKFLETKRLILRDWEKKDITPFVDMNQDPEVMKFFPNLLSRDESINLIHRTQKQLNGHGFCLFAVELKESGEFIGFVGLSIPSFQAHFTPCVEIGWRIAKKYWNRGFATEAAKAVLNQAFERYNLNEVVSFTAKINKASIRIMEKIGLQHDPKDDFNHPNLAINHPLSEHVLFRLSRDQLSAKDNIEIESYNSDWPSLAEKEISFLKKRINFPWISGIKHIGSTAIPGLAAKPILDIAVGVSDFGQVEKLIPILQEEDYIFWEDNPDKTKLFFVKGMPPFGEKRSHHIHVFPITHFDWIVRPLFRDYLIDHPQLKQEYKKLKQDLSVQYENDREAYTEAKSDFIRSVNLQVIKSELKFFPLNESHLPLLLKWLEEPHVKAWWDQEIHWSYDKIFEKYKSYVEGYKIEQGLKKPIYAYIIQIDSFPIGYIQFYNAFDFSRDELVDSTRLPKNIAALDFYLGEPSFLKRGLGVLVLKEFLTAYVFPRFSACLVDPSRNNLAAIRTYTQAGFQVIDDKDSACIQMLITNINEK